MRIKDFMCRRQKLFDLDRNVMLGFGGWGVWDLYGEERGREEGRGEMKGKERKRKVLLKIWHLEKVFFQYRINP